MQVYTCIVLLKGFENMNNKRLGMDFEQEACEVFAKNGFWVHFLSPDNRGSQPFDIIAVKDGVALAMDCKTSSTKRFSVSRMEDNQKLAFQKWRLCGNTEPYVLIKYKDQILFIQYSALEKSGVIDLESEWMQEDHVLCQMK